VIFLIFSGFLGAQLTRVRSLLVKHVTAILLVSPTKTPRYLPLPQQAQTIKSISGHMYIRKRISLTFFVKKLILWSEGLSQCLLSDATYFVCKAVTFFNEINLHPHNSYHLRNTIKLIRRSSSIIDEYIYSVRLHDIW
jgi:hypothetical protein